MGDGAVIGLFGGRGQVGESAGGIMLEAAESGRVG